MCEWLSCREFCDVRLLCGGRAFNAHRAVLASVSAFLRQILLSCPTEESPTSIVLPDFDIDAMSSVLYYIYNGEVALPKHKMDMFLDIVNAMQIFIDLPPCIDTQRYNCKFNENNETKIHKDFLLKGESGTAEKIITVKKGQFIQDVLSYSTSNLGIYDNQASCQNWSSQCSRLENLQLPYEDRQRNCFLRDLFIETYPRNGNANGRASGVLAMTSEHYRAPTSALPTNANGTHNGAEALETNPKDVSHFMDTAQFSKEIYPIHDNLVNKFNPTQINLISLFGNFHTSSLNDESVLNSLKYQSTPSYLDFRISTGNSKSSVLQSVHIPLVNYEETKLKQENSHRDRVDKNILNNVTVKRAAILNQVMESPWCPRKLNTYTPSRKKCDEELPTIKAKYVVENNDSNNNVQSQQRCLNTDVSFNGTTEDLNTVFTTPSAVREYKCTVCDQTLPNPDLLADHMKRHSSVRYTCSECPKTFSQPRNYKYHMSVHRGTREFAATCPVCGKYFNDRGYLSSHMKIHRNRKEYKCSQCPKSFNQRVAYNMHVRIHTGVKPHVCGECGKAFSRKMLLKQHQRTHSGERPYACTHCDKRFADRSNMTLHLRLHSGIKPFSCSLCPKSFTKKHHLKSHLNFHTGVKPYACPRCKVAFTQSSNMRTHLKKCSAPDPKTQANVPPSVSS